LAVCVREEDVDKTAFQTPDGLMEWVAMPFGLRHAPTTFQRKMNEISRDTLHGLVIVCLNDVYIYIRAFKEHMEQPRLVIQRFNEEGMKLRLKKCLFGLYDMEYHCYIDSGGKLSLSTKKVKAVKEWPVPKMQREVGSLVES
jgi:hypothetical protein